MLINRSWLLCTVVAFAAYWTTTLSTTWLAAFFTKALGFSKTTTGVRALSRRAAERDDGAIEVWKKETWPRVKALRRRPAGAQRSGSFVCRDFEAMVL